MFFIVEIEIYFKGLQRFVLFILGLLYYSLKRLFGHIRSKHLINSTFLLLFRLYQTVRRYMQHLKLMNIWKMFKNGRFMLFWLCICDIHWIKGDTISDRSAGLMGGVARGNRTWVAPIDIPKVGSDTIWATSWLVSQISNWQHWDGGGGLCCQKNWINRDKCVLGGGGIIINSFYVV